MQYAIIIEGEGDSFSAYAPDVPGCVAAGESVEEVTELMREALAFHFEELAATGEAIPAPASRVATIAVAVPSGATLAVAD